MSLSQNRVPLLRDMLQPMLRNPVTVSAGPPFVLFSSPLNEGVERRRGANKLISALWARRASLAKDTQRHSALHCGFVNSRELSQRRTERALDPDPGPNGAQDRRIAVLADL